MAKFSTEQIRNVAVLGHGGSGKTSLVETLLYNSGVTNRIGRVEDGTTASDWDPEEHRRGYSIHLAVVPIEHRSTKINFVDTPGYLDFVGEVISALHVCEAGLVLLDAVAGVEVGTELAWEQLAEAGKPGLVLINKIDRENANHQRALTSLHDTLEGKFLPFQLPIGQAESFQGVVNLVDMKAYLGAKGEVADIPAEMMEEVDYARQALIEAAAETDDELIVKYLDGEELSEEEVRQGLSRGVRNGEIVPVFCGTATGNIGLESLLRALTSYVPAPNDVKVPIIEGETEGELACTASGATAGFVFKTLIDRYVGRINYLRVFSGVIHKEDRLSNRRTGQEERISNLFVVQGKELEAVDELIAGDIGAVTKLESPLTGDTLAGSGSRTQIVLPRYPLPLYSVAVAPATKADSAKLGQALHSLTEEDPTLDIQTISATRQTVLRGMGEAQIDVAKHHLETKFGTKVETSVPKVPYMETISHTANASYRHKKQTGGAGQFAEVHLRLEPKERGTGFEYASEVFGGAISHSFIPSIEKGIKQVLDIGVIAGYPVVDIKAVVYDGKEHPVDSKDIAFQTAGREAFKLAVQDAGPTLLEPIYRMEITVPDEYMGDVMGDLNTKRGRVLGMEQKNNRTVVRALIPLAEIQRYGNDLRSMTQGRGLYTIEFDHYEPVPSNLAEEIIAQSKMEQEAEHA